jgi:hypothetical protein
MGMAENPGGVDDVASSGSTSGKGDESKPESSGQGKDTVAYETHKKLLSEKKKLQEDLEAIRRRDEESQKKLLEEQGEYKKLNELLKEKLTKAEEAEKLREKELLDAVKINAFREKLPGKIANPAYYGFVDLDKIVINPETGEVDSLSVEKEAKRFMDSHGRLVESAKTNPYDSSAPGKGATSYLEELKKAKSQAEFDAIRKKHGRE